MKNMIKEFAEISLGLAYLTQISINIKIEYKKENYGWHNKGWYLSAETENEIYLSNGDSLIDCINDLINKVENNEISNIR